MRVLFFGTYDTASHPRVAVLRDGLVDHGHDVIECNVPLGLDTAARVSLLRQPWRLPLLALRIATRWAQLVRAGWRHRKGAARPDVVVVGYLGHFDVVLAKRLFRGVPIALDHLIGASETATDRGVSGGARQRLLRFLDELALSRADVVVVDTDEHLADLPEAHRGRGVVVAVGAPSAWWRQTAATDDGPLRVVFFGLYTPLQGAPSIGAALAQLANDDIEVTMIGTGQDLAATKAAAAANHRVRWVDWIRSDELPAEVAAHHVCLGIFGDGRKAVQVVPNKVFQGAAAGCAIVTSDTAPQRRLLGDAATFVPAADPTALADALRSLAAGRALLTERRAAAAALAKAAFTPKAVTAPLHDALTAAANTTPTVPLPPLSPNAWLRWDAVAPLLPSGPLDVVEVGCGQGGFGARLARHHRYVGVEPDRQSFEVAQARVTPQGGRVLHGDRTALPADARFDLLVSFEVIEHIDDDEHELAAWTGLLRPGGRMVLSTPAWQHRYGAADELVGHCRRYDPDVMRAKLHAAGFVDIEVRQFGTPLGYVLETGRNVIARRRLGAAADVSTGERSGASGRLLQPSRSLTAVAAQLGTWPFRKVQRWFPHTGPGLVATARTPVGGAQPPT
ncbi:MAG: hypothetical protein RL238_136 [Actinomycetota bacterium]